MAKTNNPELFNPSTALAPSQKKFVSLYRTDANDGINVFISGVLSSDLIKM